MGQKKNGKWVVAGVLSSVLLASLIALFVFKAINANKGKPPRTQPPPPETLAE